MTYIGIDPGAKGAFSIIKDDGTIISHSFEEDTFDTFISAMDELEHQNCICCLERVTAMPGQGVTSMFNFGQNFGFIQGVLRAYHIPFELVRPQKWKKEFGITKDKNTSIEVCKRLFPSVDLKRTERCRKDDDGIAESILMAAYAKRKLSGE